MRLLFALAAIAVLATPALAAPSAQEVTRYPHCPPRSVTVSLGGGYVCLWYCPPSERPCHDASPE